MADKETGRYSVYVNEQNEIISEPLGDGEDYNDGFSLFGFTITRNKKTKDQQKRQQRQSFVPAKSPDESEEYITGPFGGRYSGVFHTDAAIFGTNEFDLITRYREAAEHPECDSAIEEIINEAIVGDYKGGSPVEIVTDDITSGEKMKKALREEFETVIELLDFNRYAYDIFRRWYIDGRLFHHIIIDPEHPNEGIQELRPIDALHIRKIKELIKEKDESTGTEVVVGVREFFLYNNPDMHGGFQHLEISPDAISYVTSGILDPSRKQIRSYLHKAIKAVNQLRIMEDSLVVYRVTRATERRVFYVDVGNLPRNRAQAYLEQIMSKHRMNVQYDTETGEVISDRKHLSMIDDYWLPRKEGGQGTEVDTLSGGEHLDEIADVEFFLRKLYKSLNVPVNRLEDFGATDFSLGRTSEITRDELKFQKFINRMRKKFSAVFFNLLRTQMVLKQYCTFEEWDEIQEQINFNYINDIYFSELKEVEIMQERVSALGDLDDYIGKYYSHGWVRRNILRQTEEEVEEMDQEIQEEKAKYGDGDDGDSW